MDIQQILQIVDERATVSSYAQAAREVRLLNRQLRPIRVSLLSSYTINSLGTYIEVEAARKGFGADVYVGPFNAVTQELLDPSSGCLAHNPDMVFIAQQLGDICPPLASDYLTLSASQIEEYVQRIISGLVSALGEFRKNSPATLVVHNFALPVYPLLGIYEATGQASQTETIRTLNARLVNALREIAGAYVLDFDRLCADIGYRNCFDDKMWHLGRAPLSAQIMPTLARTQASFIQAAFGKPRKCLVLDLDNTLWGGVVGEDGVAGIKLGQTYPGSAFRQFQQTILQLYRQGVILAINSKNNQADVDEVFKSHPDMLLKPEHFASMRINWQNKPQNMVEIADELSIGIDSLVFFDDNPAERAAMQQSLPQVMTLEVPNDAMQFSHVLLGSGAFEKLSFTDEDRRRGEMYREQAVRRDLERSATSLEDFYRDLQMTATIQPVDGFAFPRVVDLIHKTNQFNLTTRRYSAGQLSDMLADPDYGVFSLQVTDRFGDNGIVGVAIVHLQGNVASLDTMLMSCRVIGRTVETAFLRFLADWAKERGASQLEGEFIPTAKNAPAADFYSQHGFTQVSGNGKDSTSEWRLSLDAMPFEFPDYIKLASEATVTVES